MKRFKISLHSHIPYFLRPSFVNSDRRRIIFDVINYLFDITKNDEILVFGLSNFDNDERYEKFLKLTRLLSEDYKVDTRYDNSFFSVSRSKKIIYFVKTDEISTERGHILIIGYKGKLRNKKLNSLLKEAHAQKCIIIANHPLNEFKISYLIVSKLLGDKGYFSMQKKDVLKHRKEIDSLELNSYMPEDWSEIRKFSKKYNIPLVSDSDAHLLDEVFQSYYVTNNLDFSNPTKFIDSFRKSLKKGFHLHVRKHGFEAKYIHAIQSFIENVGIKTKVLTRRI